MKKLFLLCLIALVAGLVQAASIPLENASFEDPGTGKIWTGFDSASQGDVPGWSDVGGSYNDTGVENGGTVGSFKAFFQNNNQGAMQVTGYTIAAGDIYELTYDYIWGIRAELFATNDGGVTRTVLASATHSETSSGPWLDTVLSFTEDGTNAGMTLGIRLSNEGTTHGWTSVDNIR